MTINGLTIRAYAADDKRSVIDLILHIQQVEFEVPITEADQPDLQDIPAFYRRGCGNFWVAEHGGQIVGTIALIDIGAGQAAIRKMFVAAPFRGREYGTAAALLDRLMTGAKAAAVTEIYLGTVERLVAAHRFYEKNGFVRVEAGDLPPNFPRMAVDTIFYRWGLGG